MDRPIFGTDGVRGRANHDLTPEIALQFAQAAALEAMARQPTRDERPTVVVGRDGRPSGDMLGAAAMAGFNSVGCDVLVLGVVPTPCVAWATRHTKALLGLMISASHNPMPDNGLKLFTSDGYKLVDEEENAILARYDELADGVPERAIDDDVGRIYHGEAYQKEYVTAVSRAAPRRTVRKKVVVDCANGAASQLARHIYKNVGAEVETIAVDTGYKINDRSAEDQLAGLCAAVKRHRADLGLAHDGDADRCIAVDENGAVVDGDQLLAFLAVEHKNKGWLPGDAVVTTVMANLGFHQAMEAHGIEVVSTNVGDRYVAAEMRERGIILGGEQSGHIVFSEHATTGDGILTGVQIMGWMALTGKSLSELASVMTRLPQALSNVPVSDKTAVVARLGPMIAVESEGLAGRGRVLVRPSGTEQIVRVMVEAPSQQEADRVCARIVQAITS